jgi:hypothetical protein
MTNPVISQLIAADHHRRRTADAAHRRLIAVATCCRPSRILASVRALRGRLAVGQAPAVCCA